MSKITKEAEEVKDETVTRELNWFSCNAGVLEDSNREYYAIIMHRLAKEFEIEDIKIHFYKCTKTEKRESWQLHTKTVKREGVKFYGKFPNKRYRVACSMAMNVILDIDNKKMFNEENRSYIRKLIQLDKI